jgi:hypothetical protein
MASLENSDRFLKLQVVDLLLTQLDSFDTQVNYPIQERYLALIYYTLMKLTKTLSLKKSSDDL